MITFYPLRFFSFHRTPTTLEGEFNRCYTAYRNDEDDPDFRREPEAADKYSGQSQQEPNEESEVLADHDAVAATRWCYDEAVAWSL